MYEIWLPYAFYAWKICSLEVKIRIEREFSMEKGGGVKGKQMVERFGDRSLRTDNDRRENI
ncbi:MAG TPA: hypothetical protein DET40_06225 [Lentisphaeria bacterium]|nr:MAG: hypothetical protein A2X45_17905 [Lentisphaerae bacterium GWF2_50_93]HCE43123.1 hypothetical protein [Lentisphaeria bacterium]